jgi:hypothetical protein
LIYVAPERSNADKYRILIDLIKCARNHRCINAVSVGINQVKKWVKEWKVSTEQIQELYRNMHEAYAATGDSYVFCFLNMIIDFFSLSVEMHYNFYLNYLVHIQKKLH